MNCRSVAHDWTELEEGDLPFWRRLGLRVHLAVCPACKSYTRQMRATIEALGEIEEPMPRDASRELAGRLLRARKK